MVALLGPRYTYSDLACDRLRRFRGSARRYCQSITEAFRLVRYGKADFAFVPLKNSISGFIQETKKELQNKRYRIVKKLSYPIRHCVAKWDNGFPIYVIFSHPEAFRQCKKSLRRLFPEARMRNATSTAAAAAFVKKHKKGFAALCAPQTAKLLGLSIAALNVQDRKNNKTVFVLVARK